MAILPTSGFLRAARILSLDPQAQGTAIWWQDGRIREIGPAAVLSRAVPAGTPEFDYPHGLVTPGFVDAHTHFAMWAAGRTQVRLAGARSRAEAVDRVRRAVPVDGWVIGHGWDANRWADPPDRHSLDQVQSGPVFLSSVDVHAAWVNSAALKAAGIDREVTDPFGGRIVRDATGEPTGLLLERAVELIQPILPPPHPDRLAEDLRAAQAEAHRLGITGIHNVEGDPVFRAFQQLDDQDALRLRVLFHHPVADLGRLIESRISSGTGGPWLTHGGIKLFLDGSLGSRTAWMLQPYEGTRDRGMPISREETAREAMTLAAKAGLASVVHAIGDAAVRRALDLMTGLPATAIRHRIEHFQCVHPGDLGRAAGLGIVLSMQPAHILADIPLAERHWGARCTGAYAFRTLLQHGSVLAFGSDTPVASIDPREGVFAATERRMTEGAASWQGSERLDFATTAAGYTLGPAIAAGVDHRRGRLGPGMEADLVVWDGDPGEGEGSGARFRQTRAVLTVVGGEAVYNSPFAP
jgi:predicted amidohydrolase YtcJ